MPTILYEKDYIAAEATVIGAMTGIRNYVAQAIAAERERCAQIALAIDSGRGNEKEIAAAIRRG